MAPIIRGNSLYTIVDGPSWTQAEANAVKLGGHLLTINSNDEYRWIDSIFSDVAYKTNGTPPSDFPNAHKHWIGLYDGGAFPGAVGSKRDWKWSSGQQVSFIAPASETNTSNTGERYVQVNFNIPSWVTGGIQTYGFWQDYPNNSSPDILDGIAEIPLSISLNRDANPKEGAGSFTTSINLTAGTQSGIINGATIYWQISGITSDDFLSGSLTGVGTINNGKLEITHSLKVDSDTGEILNLSVFSDSSYTQQIGSTLSASIIEADPTYSLSTSATSIDEGSTLTSTVSTTNVSTGTELYYSLSGTGVTTTDFSSGSLTGSGTVSSSGSFSFSHTLANDLTTEGTETLQIRLFTDSSRSTQIASTSVSINDTSLTPPALPSYLLTPSTTNINEGSLVSTTINTTNLASGTTLYWSAVGSGITTSDFSFGALSGSASIGSDGKATFSHVLANDQNTEGSETLNILLYSDSNRSNQVATTSIAINDSSIAPPPPAVSVGGNNNGIANTGTINNNGNINTGTINSNSGNTTNNTNNTTNNITNITYVYLNSGNTTSNSGNSTNNTNSGNTLNSWNVIKVDTSVKAGDIVNQWFGNTTSAQKQVQDITDTKLMDIVASSWSDKVQINRVAKASDNGDVLEGKQRDATVDGVVGSVLSGGKGSDRIQAMAGWDLVEGGEGNDLVRAGNGRDILTGGSGKDELWGGFGWNTYKGDKDESEDLLVIKSDEWQVISLNGKAGNNPDGSKCDIIEALDSIDKIIIQGVKTSDLRFAANVTGQGLVGIGIYAKGALEALYTGGDLTVAQLTAMTTGDPATAAIGTYWSW